MTDFFQPGRAYLHHLPDGQPSGEGLFLVTHVGRAPEPFEHHSETLGVAFGWRQGPVGPNGDWDALGSYTTPDFAGWREVDLPDTTAATPDGCRWCGDERNHHGSQYTPGIGLHTWAAPTDRQRLERMHARRAAAPATECLLPHRTVAEEDACDRAHAAAPRAHECGNCEGIDPASCINYPKEA